MRASKWPMVMGMLLTPLIAAQIASAVDLKTVSDLEGGGIRYRSMIGRLDRAEFARIAAELLEPREVTLGAIAVYGSPRDRFLAGPRGEDHCGYDTWRALINARNSTQERCPQVQEAIKIGDNVVIRSVDSDCRRSTSLLRGQKSPLELLISGNRIEVLEVSFSRPMGEDNARRITADLYVRTRGLVSEQLAEAVSDRVRSITGATYLGVRLRSDTWFLTDCNFPALYPFEDRARIPDKREFDGMKYAACFVSGTWPVRCFDGAGRP